MTRRKAQHEKLKPGPKPGFSRSRAAPLAVAQTAAVVPPVESDSTAVAPAALVMPVSQARPTDPLQRHRHIGSMGEAELRAYALQVGVSKRDAETLPMDRLRVNCVHVINALIDDL